MDLLDKKTRNHKQKSSKFPSTNLARGVYIDNVRKMETKVGVKINNSAITDTFTKVFVHRKF
jgi:hypothetical protein